MTGTDLANLIGPALAIGLCVWAVVTWWRERRQRADR